MLDQHVVGVAQLPGELRPVTRVAAEGQRILEVYLGLVEIANSLAQEPQKAVDADVQCHHAFGELQGHVVLASCLSVTLLDGHQCQANPGNECKIGHGVGRIENSSGGVLSNMKLLYITRDPGHHR